MLTTRSPKALPSLRIVLTGVLLLFALARPVPSLAYTTPGLTVESDAPSGPKAYRLAPREPVEPSLSASPVAVKAADISTMEPGTLNAGLNAGTGRAATLSLFQPSLPTVQFDAPAYTVAENGGPAPITVTLSSISTDVVTVTYATSAGTATADSDYTDVGGTLVFAPGEDWKLITVPILDNSLDEPDQETVVVTLSAPISATLGTPDTALLSILDDDLPPTAQFSDSAYSVAEAAGTALITVTLSVSSENPIQVNYATIDGTATAGSDYADTSGTLALAPGDEYAVITVPITDDLLYEAEEALTLVLSAPISVTLGTPITATLSLQDDDPMPTVQFLGADYSVDEATSPAILTATLSAASGLPVTVTYTMGGGSATPDADYVADTGALVFAPGEVTRTVSVRIIDDVFDEDDETVDLDLDDPVNATRVAPFEATLTITDDDDPPTVGFDRSSYTVDEEAGEATITVTLSAPSSRTVTVNYATGGGTATAGSDYTATAGALVFSPAAITVLATVEHEFDTSAFDPPSPDPAGVAYISHLGMLLISDSEVNEIPALWEGVNLFGSTVSGVLVYTSTTLGSTWDFSDEPTGVGYNPSNHHLFFTDDSGARAVYEVYPGADGQYSTGDDIIREVSTMAFGSYDPEGVTYDSWRGYLFISDGVEEEVYEISPGDNGVFDGVLGSCPTCDDQVTHFDTDRLNVHNPEGVEFDPHTGHLYILGGADDPIAETTIAGELIRYIDISALDATNPGSLAYAPSSTDPSQWHLYIVERGYDNDSDPNENDGKAYEISFPPGETTRTFTVPIIDDVVAEGTETVNLTLSLLDDNATLDPTAYTATLNIADSLPSVQLEADSYSVDEGGGSVLVTATLSTPAAFTVTVDYAATDGTATAPDDYIAATGTLTFPAGTVAQTFSVAIINDALDELDEETINLALSKPSNAELGALSAVLLRIQDNDDPPEVRFSAKDFPHLESSITPAEIDVELSAPSALTVTVAYTTSNGTAIAGADHDYLTATGTLNFYPGITTQSFYVSIRDDALDEDNETVNLTLGPPENAVLDPATYTATLTIWDNDDPPTVEFSSLPDSVGEGAGWATITVTLSAASGKEVSVEYETSDGTALPGIDYEPAAGSLTFAPGETVRTFSVEIRPDNIDEGDETVVLTFSSATNAEPGADGTLTIEDDDDLPEVRFAQPSYSVGERADLATITVTLSHPSAFDVSVGYGTSDGTAVAGDDYETASGTLTFAPGVTVQTFDVTIKPDDVDEWNETVILRLSEPASATLPREPYTATLTILDDDPLPELQFDRLELFEPEGDRDITVWVTLRSVSERTVSVQYATGGGSATAGSDYDAISGALTFAPGTTARSFSVSIRSDVLDEANETVVLTLSEPVSATLPHEPYTATLTILDDDDPPGVHFAQPSYSVGESTGPATITVTLDAASGKEVSVDYETRDGTAVAGSDYTTTIGTLSFAPGETVQAFDVTIKPDDIDEADETIELELTGASNAEPVTPSVATLTIVDDDEQPSVEFDAASYSAGEESGQASITVTLSHPSAFDVSVGYGTSDGTAVAGDDYEAASGTLVFAPGQVEQHIEVSLLPDTLDEWDETVVLTLSEPVSATLPHEPYTATLTILDDDDPPNVHFAQPSYSVVESAGSITVTVTLSAASSNTVGVNYETSDGTALAGADYLAASGTLAFAPGVTEQAFSVTIVDTESDEENEWLRLTLSNPDSAILGTPHAVTVTIVEDTFRVYLPLILRRR